MVERAREYRLYRIGCERLGQQPLNAEEFASRWQQFEEYAERLKVAEAQGTPPDVDTTVRNEMQRRVKDDPFVKAVLVGMADEEG